MEALIHEDRVIQLSEETFEVALPLYWLNAPAGTQVGWHVSGGQVVPPPTPIKTLEEAKYEKFAAIADYRYQKETSGFMFHDELIDSSDRSKLLMNSAALQAQAQVNAGEELTFYWKTKNGTYITLTSAEVLQMQGTLIQRTDACFRCERDHRINIDSLTTVEDVEEYDFTVGWPA